MPMFTMYLIFLPEYPLHSPLCILSQILFICLRTFFTCGMTSLPSEYIGSFEKFLNATCNTDRFSVSLILSPLNMASIASFSLHSSAHFHHNPTVFSLI